MEYNEQAFKEKANLKAMKVWLALIAIMTLSYGSDLSKGIYTATQYVVFLVMAWVPFAIGLLTLKLKGRATPYYRISWLSDMAFSMPTWCVSRTRRPPMHIFCR